MFFPDPKYGRGRSDDKDLPSPEYAQCDHDTAFDVDSKHLFDVVDHGFENSEPIPMLLRFFPFF